GATDLVITSKLPIEGGEGQPAVSLLAHRRAQELQRLNDLLHLLLATQLAKLASHLSRQFESGHVLLTRIVGRRREPVEPGPVERLIGNAHVLERLTMTVLPPQNRVSKARLDFPQDRKCQFRLLIDQQRLSQTPGNGRQ